MSAADIYDQTIKPLPVEERLRLAKLILNDLSPDDTLNLASLEHSSEILDQDHLEELLLASLNSGPAVEVTPQYWESKRTPLLERHVQRSQKA